MTYDLAAFGRYNAGILRARAAYNPNPVRASFEYGKPVRPEPRPRYSVHVKAAAVEAYLAGESQRSIADRLDVKQQTISGWVKEARKGGR
jgi:transposase-like protein